MSVNDWFGNKMIWDVTDPSQELTSLMSPGTATGAGNNRFKLKPKWSKGEVVYFTVNRKPGELPAVWKTVKLFPRGNAPVPLPALPSQPKPSDIVEAVGQVKNHLKTHASTAERLDGEIDMNGARAALTLVQVPKVFPLDNAANDMEAFLFMIVSFDVTQPQGATNPDGTAGGHSVHP